MPSLTLEIKNAVGLHARPASLFVQEAKKYKSEINVTNGDVTINAKSILSILSLGADKGSTIVINAEGEDAEHALAGLQALYDSNFGEKE